MGNRSSANCSLALRTFSVSLRCIHSFSGLSSSSFLPKLLLSMLPPPIDDMCNCEEGREEEVLVFAEQLCVDDF